MGALCSKIGRRKARLVVLGLDGVGKTTILYKLKLGEVVKTIPTIGFNIETIDYKKFSLTACDVGGQDKIRVLWRHYLQDTDALIYVVDCNDRQRLKTAKVELERLLKEDDVKSTALLLVLANKQDLPNALPIGEVTELLDLNSLQNRKWCIQATTAVSGQGLHEGLDWIVEQLSISKK